MIIIQYNPLAVKENIEEKLSNLIEQNRVKVIIIPDIESVNYGRGVGYDIIEHVPPKDIGKISATKLEKNYLISKGPIANWLEQRTHNPQVRGSSPVGLIKK